MIRETISRRQARRFYDWLGRRHDWGESYERKAKERAIFLLDPEPGNLLLNVGVGTGKDQRELESRVQPDGVAVGIDLSTTMLHLTRSRTACPLCLADLSQLPFRAGSFDVLFCSYVLDLIPLAELPAVIAEFRRVMAPGGRIALVSLTEGAGTTSQLLLSAWKTLYRLAPIACGGCRPVELSPFIQPAGFQLTARELVTQMAVPSEVVIARAY